MHFFSWRKVNLFISEDLMALLTCGLCQKFCGNNIIQCRKGHVICKPCKSEGKITSCKFTHPDGRICKQTFVDAPNVVLDKLIRDVVITLLLSYLCISSIKVLCKNWVENYI